MAQTVNFIISLKDGKSIDLNEMGLISASFDRYLSDEYDETSQAVPLIDIVMFDTSGSKLLPQLLGRSIDEQKAKQNKIRFKYGFGGNSEEETSMSHTYELTIVNVKNRWTNRGSTISIGAVATYIREKSPAVYFPAGTKVKEIIKSFAANNGWDIGHNADYLEFDDDLKLSKDVYKKANDFDVDFIKNEIVPLINTATSDYVITGKSSVFKSIFSYNGTTLQLMILPTKGLVERRVWRYSVGDAYSDKVLDFTGELDVSFLLNGVNIKLPNDLPELSILKDEDKQEVLDKFINSKVKEIEDTLTKYNVPLVLPDQLKFRWEISPDIKSDNLTLEEIILKEVDRIIQSITTSTLTVVGNPKLNSGDLIELKVFNQDGTLNFISSNTYSQLWRIIKITEDINLSGYTTTLKLVRESINFVPEVKTTTSGGGKVKNTLSDFTKEFKIEQHVD